jgi:RNA polymerase sigma-70 factor (ECF subfamily)
MKMYEKTFKNTILPLKDKLYRLALRIEQDTAEAEDIVQDTLIRIWEKRTEWEAVESFDALGLTICRNLALDRIARKGAQNVELLPEEMDTTHASDPFSQVVAEESLNLIGRFMEELPVRQREVFQLRDMEGMAYKEIAETLHLSAEQVKVYLFRARGHIKKRFEEIQNYGLHLH